MNWFSVDGIIVMGILTLSAVLDILFLVLFYRIFVRIFRGKHFGIKVLSAVVSFGLCVPFVIALHRITILFLVQHRGGLWLIIMALLCSIFAASVHKLGRAR